MRDPERGREGEIGRDHRRAAERRGRAGELGADPRRRETTGVQDAAIYTCSCGFVFQAAVSTTVGCPHCGDAQAW